MPEASQFGWVTRGRGRVVGALRRWGPLGLALAMTLGVAGTTPNEAVAGSVFTFCFGKMPTIVAQPGVPTQGTGGDDVILGTDGPDIINGSTGNDLICGRGDADTISGGSGNDKIDGGLGDDTLDGGSGDDLILGEDDNDKLYGGSGKDDLDGGRGNDQMYGGGGDDRLFDNAGTGQVFDGGGGINTCVGTMTANPIPPGSVANCQIILP